MRWMNLEPIIHSEVSQKGKDKYCILTHKYHILTYIWNLEKWYWRICLQGSRGETDIENSQKKKSMVGYWEYEQDSKFLKESKES